MPIQKAAFKALTQNKKRAEKNKKIKSDVTALIKRVHQAIEKKDVAKAADWLKQTIKKLDLAAQKKVIKKNTAARKKSRLAKAVNALKN